MVLIEMAGAEDTIYLCNFRVSVDGDWLCLKELAEGGSRVERSASTSPGSPPPSGAHPQVPSGSLHNPSLSDQAMLTPADATLDGSSQPAEAAPPPVAPSLSNEGGAMGGALSVLPGLPPGLFAPYVPLTCGPSARFLLLVATVALLDTV